MKYVKCGAGVCSLRTAEGCRDTDVVIPDSVFLKGKVVEIDNYAFRNETQINSVAVPEGIVSIGDGAFENCTNLETILLPQTLKSIGRNAFLHCEKLRSVLLPAGLTSIADASFACCYSLEAIDLRCVRSIGKYAFAKCDSLRNITISDSLEKIYAHSFQDTGYAKNRTQWTGGLLSVGKWVIGCNGLSDEYTIPRSTVGIAADVFHEEQHVKRTRNPEYDYLMEQFETALVCPQAPLPDFSGVPEHFEEIVPVKLFYEGTSEEWNKIVKLPGEKRIPAVVTTLNGTIHTSF